MNRKKRDVAKLGKTRYNAVGTSTRRRRRIRRRRWWWWWRRRRRRRNWDERRGCNGKQKPSGPFYFDATLSPFRWRIVKNIRRRAPRNVHPVSLSRLFLLCLVFCSFLFFSFSPRRPLTLSINININNAAFVSFSFLAPLSIRLRSFLWFPFFYIFPACVFLFFFFCSVTEFYRVLLRLFFSIHFSGRYLF